MISLAREYSVLDVNGVARECVPSELEQSRTLRASFLKITKARQVGQQTEVKAAEAEARY